jgi:hypothetical protein
MIAPKASRLVSLFSSLNRLLTLALNPSLARSLSVCAHLHTPSAVPPPSLAATHLPSAYNPVISTSSRRGGAWSPHCLPVRSP